MGDSGDCVVRGATVAYREAKDLRFGRIAKCWPVRSQTVLLHGLWRLQGLATHAARWVVRTVSGLYKAEVTHWRGAIAKL